MFPLVLGYVGDEGSLGMFVLKLMSWLGSGVVDFVELGVLEFYVVDKLMWHFPWEPYSL